MSCSDKQLLANQANALRSTGPTSAEGKAISRRNALKHGLTAEVVPMAGEDPETLDSECQAWVKELAPTSLVAKRLAEGAFRSFVLLQRCHRAADSRMASRVRRARELWEADRTREVSQAIEEMKSSRACGVARLRTTAEGCAWLIAGFETLSYNLQIGGWDMDQYERTLELCGIDEVGHIDLSIWSSAIVAYASWGEELRKKNLHDASHEKLESLYGKKVADDAVLGRTEMAEGIEAIGRFLDERLAELREREARLRQATEEDLLDAESFVLFDDTDEARLLHRYTSEAERQIHANHKKANEAEKKLAGKHTPKRVETAENKAETVYRNEPILEPSVTRPSGPPTTPVGPISSGIADFMPRNGPSPPQILIS
jgi:hypothetical protein